MMESQIIAKSRLAIVLLILLEVLLQVSCPLFAETSHATARPPNLVLILADDLGYGDCGC